MTRGERLRAVAAVRTEGLAASARRISPTAVGGGALYGGALNGIPELICGAPVHEVAKRSFWGHRARRAAATAAAVSDMAAFPPAAPFIAPAVKGAAVAGGAATAYDGYRAATDPARCQG